MLLSTHKREALFVNPNFGLPSFFLPVNAFFPLKLTFALNPIEILGFPKVVSQPRVNK